MYASKESEVLKELGPGKVECPRCDGPMEFKEKEPVFCNSCGWPDRWSEKKPSRKRKKNNSS